LSKTAHAIEREYQVLAALSDTDVPTPKVYCLCEDNDVLGTPFYVSTICDDADLDNGVFERTNIHGPESTGIIS
jgi:aminoglycoside phosphotransferase (APT) family kinase protein